MARGHLFSQFAPGQRFVSVGRTITEADVVLFAGISGDYNPLHTDATFAAQTPFKQRIAHGMLSASISTGLGQTLGIFEGTTLALMGQTFDYKGPVFFGDTIRLALTVETATPSSKGGKGVVVFRSEVLCTRKDGVPGSEEAVITGTWTVLFRDA